jgi:hypothetical protein
MSTSSVKKCHCCLLPNQQMSHHLCQCTYALGSILKALGVLSEAKQSSKFYHYLSPEKNVTGTFFCKNYALPTN